MRERWEHVMNIDHNLQSALGRDITRDARSLDELALSPDGSTLVALRFGAISVWNTRDGSLVDSLLEPLATLSLNRLTPFVRGGTVFGLTYLCEMPWNNSGDHGARIYALDARGLRPWAELRLAPDRSHAFVGLAQDGRSALVFDGDFHAQHLYEWPLDESTAQFSRARARSVELDAKISDARYNAEGAIEVIAENRWLRRDAAQWIELARLDGHNARFAGVGVCTIDGESGEGLVFTEDGSARSCIWSDQRWACGALARVFAASGALWVTDVSRGIEWGPIPLESEPADELVAISADARTIAAVDGAHITVFRLVRDR